MRVRSSLVLHTSREKHGRREASEQSRGAAKNGQEERSVDEMDSLTEELLMRTHASTARSSSRPFYSLGSFKLIRIDSHEEIDALQQLSHRHSTDHDHYHHFQQCDRW